MESKKITRMVSNLFRFMLIFNIDRFHLLEERKGFVRATVGWGDDGAIEYNCDDETQDIEWSIPYGESLDDALLICDYIRDHDLMKSDKIKVSKQELESRIADNFGWASDRISEAIDALLRVKVDMVDDGRKTDFFFVHF